METQKKILVIEDDDVFRESLIDILAKEGYDAIGAREGGEAVDLAQEQTYDLIISDVRLPGEMDGIETAAVLKEQMPNVKIIVITGYADKEAPIRAIRLGIEDYIYKPFDLDEFMKKVGNCFYDYS